MKNKRRKSAQRDRIYYVIKNTSSHPTALWIYEKLKKEMPSVSLGNVYRNIKILVEEGRIQIREFSDGIEHYDAIPDLHYHFICDKCKGITDFILPVQDDITRLAQKSSGHKITGHTIQFFGICEKCKKKLKIKEGKYER